MKLEVQSCKFVKEFTTQGGVTLRSYNVMGLLDGELDSVQMNAKSDATAPKVGETIEVTVEETQWGKKAKKVNVGGFSNGGRGHTEDPEKQRMIVRQNALSNAVTFLLGQVENKAKTKEDLTTDNVLLIASKFAGFSLGEIKPTISHPREIDISELPDIEPQDFPEE